MFRRPLDAAFLPRRCISPAAQCTVRLAVGQRAAGVILRPFCLQVLSRLENVRLRLSCGHSRQQFMQRQDRHVRRARGEKLLLTCAEVSKLQMTGRRLFNFASAIENCEHAKEGCSRCFRAKCLKKFTVCIAHSVEPFRSS